MGRGKWGDVHYPHCAGHEIICQILQAGKDVKNVKVGETVGFGPINRNCGKCKFCVKGWNQACQNITFNDRFIQIKRFGG